VVDKTERQVMAKIVELRKLGNSWQQIALTLLRDKIVARTGQEWSVSRVRRAYFAELHLGGEESPGTKRCMSRGLVQLADKDHFWPRRQQADGLDTQCRVCRRQQRQLTRWRARLSRQKARTMQLMAALKRGVGSPVARWSILARLGGKKGFVREFSKAYNAAPLGSVQHYEMVLAVGKWLLRG